MSRWLAGFVDDGLPTNGKPVGAAAAFGSLFRPNTKRNISSWSRRFRKFMLLNKAARRLRVNIKRVTSTVLRRNSKHKLFYVCPSSSSQKNDVSRHEFEPSQASGPVSNGLIFLGCDECIVSTVHLSAPSQTTRRIQPSHCLTWGDTVDQPQLPKSSTINTPR